MALPFWAAQRAKAEAARASLPPGCVIDYRPARLISKRERMRAMAASGASSFIHTARAGADATAGGVSTLAHATTAAGDHVLGGVKEVSHGVGGLMSRGAGSAAHTMSDSIAGLMPRLDSTFEIEKSSNATSSPKSGSRRKMQLGETQVSDLV